MLDEAQALRQALEAFPLHTPADADEFKRRFTGKKGALSGLFEALKQAPTAEKARLGQELNALKLLAEARLQQWAAAQGPAVTPTPSDPTLPGYPVAVGGRHPLRRVQSRIVKLFIRQGFTLADGPEVEDDWHNFTALNFPPDHPARDMQDTFFLQPSKPDSAPLLLRTHTSSVQVRLMETQPPPHRHIMPGRVFRNETISARAHCFFHQVEGLVIERGVSFADLKQCLRLFVDGLFGPEVPVRLRPSYFPFTEMSAEMDIACRVCMGSGCTVCKHSGWVEILGCGMVDPAVLQACGLDPDVYSGYAFGMGVERIAQLLYRVPDLRLYSQNDLRFLAQFRLPV